MISFITLGATEEVILRSTQSFRLWAPALEPMPYVWPWIRSLPIHSLIHPFTLSVVLGNRWYIVFKVFDSKLITFSFFGCLSKCQKTSTRCSETYHSIVQRIWYYFLCSTILKARLRYNDVTFCLTEIVTHFRIAFLEFSLRRIGCRNSLWVT